EMNASPAGRLGTDPDVPPRPGARTEASLQRATRFCATYCRSWPPQRLTNAPPAAPAAKLQRMCRRPPDSQNILPRGAAYKHSAPAVATRAARALTDGSMGRVLRHATRAQ